MSHITSGILGGAAMALMMGAIQLASGSDLRATVIPANAVEASQVNSEAVNRSAKADRVQVTPSQDAGRTLSFRVHSLPDTSLLLRVTPTPVKIEKVVKPEVAAAQHSGVRGWQSAVPIPCG